MKIAFHQPNYLPNLGFFYKMAQVDRFIIFTNPQFSKGDGWVRRHKIKGSNNDIWLTVPVNSSFSEGQQIKDVMIDNMHKWRHKHIANIKQSYGGSVEKEALAKLDEIYHQRWDRLADLNIALIHCIKDILKIETEVIIDEEVEGEKWDLLINTCKKYDGDTYLSGMGGKEYMTEDHYAQLEKAGITLEFVEHDVTSQYPYTSLHYIFTEGVEKISNFVKNPDSEQIEDDSLLVAV